MGTTTATRPRCLGCGVTVREASLPLCIPCRDCAEAVFRLTHSPLDRDWIAARNRFFGRPDVVRAALDEALEAAGEGRRA